MEPGKFSAEELSLLRALNDKQVRFLIVGLSAAVLQGATVVTQDVDLWIDELGRSQFLEALKSVGAFYIPPGVAGGNPPMIGPAQFRLFDIVIDVHGIGLFNEEYEKSCLVDLDGVPVKVLSLESIIKSKTSLGRAKDHAVLPALEAARAVKK